MAKSTELGGTPTCTTGHVWSSPPAWYVKCLRCFKELSLDELLTAYLAQHPEDEREP